MDKQEYEAQVKFDDNVNPLVKPGALWKTGDIVDIHPKGWIWSKAEKEHFLLINVGFLDESEAEAMLGAVTAARKVSDGETSDDTAAENDELIARSRYKVDIARLLDKLPSALVSDVYNRDVEAQPFQKTAIEKSDIIEDITLRPEIQEAILKAGE